MEYGERGTTQGCQMGDMILWHDEELHLMYLTSNSAASSRRPVIVTGPTGVALMSFLLAAGDQTVR